MEVITVYFKKHFLLDSEEYHTDISQDNGTTGDESNSGPRDAKQDCKRVNRDVSLVEVCFCKWELAALSQRVYLCLYKYLMTVSVAYYREYWSEMQEK
jgi:hypothetical protein